jgi:hypothetical protein
MDKQQVEDVGTYWNPKYLYSSTLYGRICNLRLYDNIFLA